MLIYALFLFGIHILNLQYGETPLHMAAKNGCNEAAKMLLAHGASLEAKANVCPFLVPFLFSSMGMEICVKLTKFCTFICHGI